MESSRVQVLTAALTVSMMIDEEDIIIVQGMRRRHRYWVSPYLRPRTDTRQRNTLAKLERDFLRVSNSCNMSFPTFIIEHVVDVTEMKVKDS